MFATLVKGLRRLENEELSILVALLIVVLGSWAFVDLAGEVSEGDTQAFDEAVLRAMRTPDDPAVPIGPLFIQDICRDITALGGYGVLIVLVTMVAGFLYLDAKKGAMRFLLGAVLGGYVLGLGLKAKFARPRPTIVPFLANAYQTSFPSGHAMMAAIVYLTLGVLLARLVGNRRGLRVYFLSVALLLTGLVGISRVYLGVHYPTDVLAGWTAGLVWATFCSLVAQWLQKRGMIESEL